MYLCPLYNTKPVPDPLTVPLTNFVTGDEGDSTQFACREAAGAEHTFPAFLGVSQSVNAYWNST
jgi:hypothetical protein